MRVGLNKNMKKNEGEYPVVCGTGNVHMACVCSL